MSETNKIPPFLDTYHETPRHGFQGDRREKTPGPRVPSSLTIAISRETGTRGTTIARKVGERLGWQVYTSDLLGYSTQEERVRQDIFDSLSPEAITWVEEQTRTLLGGTFSINQQDTREVVRLVLALGSQGEAIIVGRGAGCVLPPHSTLNVRLIAPLKDRISYMTQWMRLTREEATEQVYRHDQQRTDFVESNFQISPQDPHQYDLILNTRFMGEELAADLIVRAAQAKLENLFAPSR